jgi:hypothetical protein
MICSAATHRPGAEFDAFLFALVGEDKSGLPLSVVSVLARADIDPWLEAAELAKLSPESAAQKMVSILGALPTSSLKSSDILASATCLVAMLPPPAPTITARLGARSVCTEPAVPRAHANGLVLAIYLIFMVAAQLIMSHGLATHADPASAPQPSSSPSQLSPGPAEN